MADLPYDYWPAWESARRSWSAPNPESEVMELRSRFPAAVTVSTYNAGVNDHMNAVNRALGYEIRQHLIGLQKMTG